MTEHFRVGALLHQIANDGPPLHSEKNTFWAKTYNKPELAVGDEVHVSIAVVHQLPAQHSYVHADTWVVTGIKKDERRWHDGWITYFHREST